jgi:hypothetical protein
MNTPVRLATFGLGLAAAFAAAVGIGAAVGPVHTEDPGAAMPAGHGDDGAAHGAEGHEAAPRAAPAGSEMPGGLMVSEGGYTLDLDEDIVPAAGTVPVSFRVLGPDGRALTEYEKSHEEDLHLVAVRRDLSGFQHVHPTVDADGVWTTPLDLTPGSWRLFADFVPGGDGENRILGADLAVAGEHVPVPLPAPSTTAEVDGYTVTLSGELTPGQEAGLTLSVSRQGGPVTDLQPYLGAYGHLVVLRAGDLAYLHVHPVGGDHAHPGGEDAAGPDIEFATTPPSAGTYRLFLDFKHGGVVRTAAFTVAAGTHEEGH